MVPALAAIVLGGASFAKPIPWAINFAAPGDFCFAGDVNGDGYADLIRVSPKGDSFIDVALNASGMKSLVPQRANSNWGKECQAACIGEIDEVGGMDIVGVFGGDTLRLAHAFKDGSFKDEKEWIKLPRRLRKPRLVFSGGLRVAESGARQGWALNLAAKTWSTAAMPPAATDPDMESDFPAGPSKWSAADMDHDGDDDWIQFRFGPEPHTGHNVLLYRAISSGETDSDHDGLSNDEEAKLGTDPSNPDTDGDGLLDGWETGEFRGLDMKGMGCDPRRPDVICLISRFSIAGKDMVEQTFKTIQGYYTGLGWALHPIFIDEVNEIDQKQPWWALRDKFLPAKWRGVVHWMQITPWGGGQADQLGDGGGCGGNGWTLYATFIHEFGHQLGLSHEGFYGAAWCPTYPSMMNYAYSYGYEDDIKKIRYSDGALAQFQMRESDLDETLPLPYERVKFLERGPYHYRLKKDGDKTLIDWNWNGIFGEKHVRADVNYAYSTTAGRRDEVGKTQCAPWTFVHDKVGYVLYAQQGVKADGKGDPSVLPDKPGWLLLRRLIKPFQWGKEVRITAAPPSPAPSGAPSSQGEGEAVGDPVAISYRGEIVVAYPSVKGLAVRWLKLDGDQVTQNDLVLVDDTKSVPSLGIAKGRLYLLERTPADGMVRYRMLSGRHRFGESIPVPAAGAAGLKSTVAVSLAADTIRDEVLLGVAENQDDKRPDRWALRRFKVGPKGQLLVPNAADAKPDSNREWIEGDGGGARGGARCIVLFDERGLTGMKGRILYFSRGGISEKAPWACEYVAQSIGDKTIRGGWMVKRFYDEWTQSRSSQAACWFNGDILYAYRWADGSQGDRDNILHVSYNGTGIEQAPMGDFDDIGFIRSFGMRHSILYLRQ